MKKNKLTIEWHSLLKDLIRNIWIVVLSALIGLMGHYLVNHASYEPEYTSTATLSVFSSAAGANSHSALNTSIEKANVLTNILTEPSIKECAAEYLEIESFDGKISADVLDQTNFIELRVTSDHPEKSYKLLNAVIKSHHKVSSRVFKNAGLTVLRMPSVPTAPSNRISNGNRNTVVLACITVALAIILAFSITRNTVKKEKDFNDKIDSKLIGTVAHEDKQMTWKDIKQKNKKGLLIHNNAYISLRFTENFHKIAAKLEHIKKSDGSKTFAITSVAENEGKSTCAANLAVSLADRGNNVVLVDFDFKKPALYKIFGEEFKEESELSYLLSKQTDKKNFKFRTFKKTSLYLAINTQHSPEYHSWISDNTICELIEKLRAKFDFVIIDTAPVSLDSTVTDIIRMVDKTVMVVRTDTVAVPVLNDCISTLSTIGENLAGCILNDVYMGILPFSFTGNDESNYYGHKYGKYNHYGHYGKHHVKSETDSGNVQKDAQIN